MLSFDQLEELFCGELGYKPWEFYQLTPREANNIVNGYRRKELEQFKVQATLFRELEFAFIGPYLDKKHKNLTAQKYKPFAWEKPINNIQNKKPKTREELKAYWDKIDQQKKENHGR